MNKKIPGIEIIAYPISEALLQCKFRMTYSDALELCKRTKSGLLKNKDFKDWFFDKVTEELLRSIEERKVKYNVPLS